MNSQATDCIVQAAYCAGWPFALVSHEKYPEVSQTAVYYAQDVAFGNGPRPVLFHLGVGKHHTFALYNMQ